MDSRFSVRPFYIAHALEHLFVCLFDRVGVDTELAPQVSL